MNNLVTRSISGAVYVALIVAAILSGGYWMLWLVMLMAFLAITEFNIISNTGERPAAAIRAIDLVTAGMALLLPYAYSINDTRHAMLIIPLLIALLLARMIVALYIRNGNPLTQLAHSFMAQLYITVPMMILLMVYYDMPNIVLLMFIMIWLNDTGAFCVGSLIGKNKLFERISPKKSWEGFFGGMAFSIMAGIVASAVWGDSYFSGFAVWQLAVLGAVVSTFATWGDLVESLIKRTLGIKDSGNIIPGHGGILDRIDSLLLVAPATMIYMLFILVLR